MDGLSKARFPEDETYTKLKESLHPAFAQNPVREAAHARSAYPGEMGPLRNLMQKYLDEVASTQEGLIGIAATQVSPEGGWLGCW
jgi:hypothetical protein